MARYLQEESNSIALITQTMGHEMIHYWLWSRGLPYGHTSEFSKKMKEMGVPRFNPAPRFRAAKFIYECLHCRTEFPARKRWSGLACAACCKVHSGGRYDLRFRLLLKKDLQEV